MLRVSIGKIFLVPVAVVVAAGTVVSAAGPSNDLGVVGRIKTEAFDRSHVMDTLSMMCDRYGPRLTASPEFEEAAQWALGSMRELGLQNVHAEKWGPFGRSWSMRSLNLEMTEPRFSHLVAVPLAWSSPVAPGSGETLYAPFRVANRLDVNATRAALDKYKEQWKGKLKGHVVLLTDIASLHNDEKPDEPRYSAAELTELASAPTPTARHEIKPEEIQIPTDPAEARKYVRNLPPEVTMQLFEKREALTEERMRFLHDEGVAALVTTDDRAHNGLLFAESAGTYKAASTAAPATFIIPQEQYTRMVRLIEHKERVALRYALDAKTSEKDVDGQNLVAELPGRSKPDEVVMIGAHFDSWHSGTGATDNAAGSAVMMEVMRILKTLDLPMERTVRIALWSGEEQGLLGSRAYVKEHFGDPKTMQVKPEHAKLDAYLNLDNGSGKIRGVYMQGNDAARPLFTEWMRPFADMGASTITLRNTGSTDHVSFDAIGLPGFQFIQDPLDYSSVTHHSDADTVNHVVPEDLMQASAVIATLAYDIANAPEMFPRKAMPPARTQEKSTHTD